MKQKMFLASQFKANNELMEKMIYKVIEKIESVTSLNLPMDVPDNIQELYEELGCPFFDSFTKKQVTKLARLQRDLFKLHVKYKKLVILKSQKITVSSLCILAVIWHALRDCMGMEIIINAQSDDQAKSHAQDLRRIILGSDKYRDYLIREEFTALGLLKDEVTKIHTIYLHNPKMPRLPTKIIITGMSPGALLSHKRVGFVWSSDMTISNLTSQRQNEVWAAMNSRLALTRGPVIVECPTRAPAGPVYDTYERYQKNIEDKVKLNPEYDFHVFRFTYELGLRDKLFTPEFIESEKISLGPMFGAFYGADFFASGHTWYKEEHFSNITDEATELFLQFHPQEDRISDVTDD